MASPTPAVALRTLFPALADALGSMGEIVTRLLRAFGDKGSFDLTRERIRIKDRAAVGAA